MDIAPPTHYLVICGRSSTFNAARTRTIVAILLADLLPGVKADCTIDRFGDEHCTLSVAARIGSGFLLFFLLVALAWYTRYRHRPAAQIYIAKRTSRTPGAQTTARVAPACPTHPNTRRRRVEAPPPSPYMRTTPAQDSLRPLAHCRSTTRLHQARPRSSNTRCHITVSLSRCQRETGDTSGFGR
ncbi:hypothetical protein EDB92DRAFT_2106966 [Lactarius akahatsu]|uniref:Uncharacterized protein n=1 Tax=Lactarius akahatsu TaxID=416441 RepID=A0AAD4Q3L6_9AGAM|nr:hypothetical protein EDB92DRAFT_2106966 [Lactarius akahatsu]